jgi:hypothetical protein
MGMMEQKKALLPLEKSALKLEKAPESAPILEKTLCVPSCSCTAKPNVLDSASQA